MAGGQGAGGQGNQASQPTNKGPWIRVGGLWLLTPHTTDLRIML